MNADRGTVARRKKLLAKRRLAELIAIRRTAQVMRDRRKS